jgi:hypothetical protein
MAIKFIQFFAMSQIEIGRCLFIAPNLVLWIGVNRRLTGCDLLANLAEKRCTSLSECEIT